MIPLCSKIRYYYIVTAAISYYNSFTYHMTYLTICAEEIGFNKLYTKELALYLESSVDNETLCNPSTKMNSAAKHLLILYYSFTVFRTFIHNSDIFINNCSQVIWSHLLIENKLVNIPTSKGEGTTSSIYSTRCCWLL